MHVNIKDLQAGAWLMVDDRYARFVGFAEHGAAAEIMFDDEKANTIVAMPLLRPVFINNIIIQQCGFSAKGNMYTNGLFEISIGGANSIYKITGNRVKRPFVTHLLSQLHIFQNIYRKETGQELEFKPKGHNPM